MRIVLNEGKVATNAYFPIVALHEPRKEQVLAWRPGTQLTREASIVAYDLQRHRTYEGIVDLLANKTRSWKLVPGAEPLQTGAEFGESGKILKTNTLWIEALTRRGITDLASVETGAIPIGPVPLLKGHSNTRTLVTVPFLRTTNRTTWEPIEGLTAFVDMSHRQVLKVIDRGVYPISHGKMDFFDPAIRGPQDPPQKPLQVSLPQGPTFRIDDHAITWNRWRFRYALHPRDGLILYQIGWEDAPGKVRPILYRASISDLLVPYADTDEAWSWRAYFDEADFGLGYFTTPLKPGFTTVSYATLISEPLTDGVGGTRILTNAVDVYERDAGILWSHTEGDSGTVGPRARELVIGHLTTIGNYDYRFQWSFRQDGSIELHIYLTGIMQLKGTHATHCAACQLLRERSGTATPQGEQAHGVLVAENLLAPHHQHFLNVRLDFDIDGTSNSVKEYNLTTDRLGRSNPHGNGFSLAQTVFSTERQAVRDMNPATHRMWTIFNPDTLSALGHPSGYQIDPGMIVVPFLAKDSPVRRRAGYIDHQFVVTRYNPTELYAAGNYPGGHNPLQNLTTYARNNESIQRQDLVTWVTLGVTHVARPEDFPVMPSAHVSMRLTPKAFFNRNPALAVPDSPVSAAPQP